ncbi:MAG: hypothetical protein ACE5HY_03520, partial [Candidatus Hydrothermarchaeales archaeon]
WHIDYKRVYEFLKKDYEISVACYFTGTPHYEDTKEIKQYRKFKNSLIYAGYTVIEKEVKIITPKLPEFVLQSSRKPLACFLIGQ